MKKFALICLSLLIIVHVFLAACFEARPLEALSGTPKENTHLNDPAAITADGSRVVIAENYGGNTKLHIFTDAGLATIPVTGRINKIRIRGMLLFMLQPDRFTVFDLDAESVLFSVETDKIASFDINDEYLCIAFGNCVKQIKLSSLTESDINTNENEGAHELPYKILDIALIKNFLHVIVLDNGITKHRKYDFPAFTTSGSPWSAIESGSRTLAAGDAFWLYVPDGTELNGAALPFPVKDAAYVSDNEIYLLDGGECVVRQYRYDGGCFSVSDPPVVLGSNKKDFELPSCMRNSCLGTADFRLAEIKTGEVYAYLPEKLDQTGGWPGWSGYLPAGQTVMVLGGEINGFSLIWFEDGSVPGNECKFSFVETAMLDFDNTAGRLASAYPAGTPFKIPGAAAQKLYFLPKAESKWQTQGISAVPPETRITLILSLNGFDGGKWSLVSFEYNGATLYGFMLNSVLKDPEAPADAYEVMKANPPVFKTLNIYGGKDESSGAVASAASGERLKVFEKYADGWSRVVTADGIEGYVLTSQLIAENGMTNTFAAGLVTFIGLALAALFLIFLRRRRKKLIKHTNQDPALFSDLEKLD